MKIFNKRATFDYELLEKLEVGVVLTGAEVKAAIDNRVDLSRSFAKIIGGEMYLVNASFSGTNITDSTRSRKLLLHKREILALATKLAQKKLTLVPVVLYTSHGRVKLEIALARSKREFQKRESIKKRDITRDIERELK